MDDPERGSTSVLTATGIGMLAVMAMLGLGGRAVVERRAVEDSIAGMRAYWAAMGISTYVLSRVRFDGTNGHPAQEIAKAATQEIADGTANKELLTTWRYPDVSASYAIVVNPADPADDGGPSAPGEVRLTYDFQTASTASGTPDALRTLPTLRLVEFKYCVVPTLATACGNAPPKDSNYTLQRITSVHRPLVAAK